MKQELIIRTPEGIVFPLTVASPVARFVALAIDQACIQAAASALATACGVIGLVSSDLAGAIWMVAWFFLSAGYPVALEWRLRGQTIGKRVMRLRVMDVQGLRLTFSQVVVRNLLRFVDAMPGFYLVGGTSAMLTARGQRVGDIAANTLVVYQPPQWEPDLAQVLPDKFNSFRAYPHLAARLRQVVTPREAGVLVRALLRRDTLDPEARVTLFDTLRRRVQEQVRFPAEAVEALSAEQYIRNVVELLFSRA